MPANGPMTQGARASVATMILLTWFSWNIMSPSLEARRVEQIVHKSEILE